MTLELSIFVGNICKVKEPSLEEGEDLTFDKGWKKGHFWIAKCVFWREVCIEEWFQVFVWAPEVPFFITPKCLKPPKIVHWGWGGGVA